MTLCDPMQSGLCIVIFLEFGSSRESDSQRLGSPEKTTNPVQLFQKTEKKENCQSQVNCELR